MLFVHYIFIEFYFSCHCHAGFTGLRCEHNIDDCLNNKCQNNATCVDLVDSYHCKCPAGFMGDYCEKKIPFCTEQYNPCKNNARCVDHDTYYTCECLPGFKGENCSINIDDCENHMCQVTQKKENETVFLIPHFLEWCYVCRWSEWLYLQMCWWIQWKILRNNSSCGHDVPTNFSLSTSRLCTWCMLSTIGLQRLFVQMCTWIFRYVSFKMCKYVLSNTLNTFFF